jgi:hypothetical protein
MVADDFDSDSQFNGVHPANANAKTMWGRILIMLRRTLLISFLFAGLALVADASTAQAQMPAPTTQAYGKQWANSYNTQDWERFYHYPYVYYPHNYYGSEYYRSAESLYYRYPMEMRIPVYNTGWHNYYPEGATWNKYNYGHKGPPGGGKYHSGHQFILDVF